MLSSNISSLKANQVFLNNNANNIANANSDGFRPSDTQLSSTAKGSVIASTRLIADSGSSKSQTELAKEIPNQITVLESVKANVSAIKTQDEMFGTLLDIKA